MNLDALKKIGTEWTGGNKHRIYFNDIELLAALTINRYNTGSISSATFKGSKISNRQAANICPDFYSKLWYDVKEQDFYSANLDSSIFHECVSGILKKMHSIKPIGNSDENN